MRALCSGCWASVPAHGCGGGVAHRWRGPEAGFQEAEAGTEKALTSLTDSESSQEAEAEKIDPALQSAIQNSPQFQTINTELSQLKQKIKEKDSYLTLRIIFIKEKVYLAFIWATHSASYFQKIKRVL